MAASLDRAAFFNAVRTPLFGGSLTASQVSGMEAILDACPPDFPRWWLSYCLATAFHEVAQRMTPIREFGLGKGKPYGVPVLGQAFYGRGLVQLTWVANYAKATKRLRELGYLTTTQDLTKTPDLALEPATAAAIMFVGMREGWFTGKKLADYLHGSTKDAVNARRIINGTDCAALIAGYFASFDKALVAAGYSPNAISPVIPIPPVQMAPLPPPLKPPATTPPTQPAPPAIKTTGGLFGWLANKIVKAWS